MTMVKTEDRKTQKWSGCDKRILMTEISQIKVKLNETIKLGWH
jgi:hypothetical protein